MRSFLYLLGGLALLAACQPVDTPTEGFGDAVRQNMAAQIINPEPRESALGRPEEFDGDRAAAAMQRYREGKVYKPVVPNASAFVSSPGVSQ